MAGVVIFLKIMAAFFYVWVILVLVKDVEKEPPPAPSTNRWVNFIAAWLLITLWPLWLTLALVYHAIRRRKH